MKAFRNYFSSYFQLQRTKSMVVTVVRLDGSDVTTGLMFYV